MRTASVVLAGSVERRLAGVFRRLRNIGEQRADRLLCAVAAKAELAKALRARVLRGVKGGPGALLHAAGGRAKRPRLGVGPRKQRRDQRSGGKSARKRDQRGFGERVGNATASVRVDRAPA